MYKTSYDATTKIWQGVQKSPMFHPNISIGQAVLYTLSQRPEHTVQISEESGVSVTNWEMQTRIVRIAMNLCKLGYKKGDMVAVACKNSENLAPVVFACCVIGAPVNTLDPTFARNDMAHMFGTTKPKLVFCDFDNISVVQEALKQNNLEAEIITLIKSVQGFQFIENLILEVENENNFSPPEIGDGSKEPAIICCSSGTSGLSKGVILSHAQLLNIVHFNGRTNFCNQISISFSSLYWLSGIGTLIGQTITSATRIITTTPFSPELAFRMVEKYKVNFMRTPPLILTLLLQSPLIEKANLTSLRVYQCGGSPLPQHLNDKMKKYMKYGIIIPRYGLSEICVGISRNVTGVKSSVGQLNPQTSVKILSEDGEFLGVGEDGEILAKSYYTFLGYYGDEEQTRNMLDSEGWLHTGDIGHFDENGNLYVIDRKKDIIKYKGYQYSSSEIEELLSKHPSIAAVSVVAIPDDIVTDLPAAVIVKVENLKISEKEVFDLVADNMSEFKKLFGGVYFVDELPITASGKVRKNIVKQMAIEMYNKRNSE